MGMKFGNSIESRPQMTDRRRLQLSVTSNQSSVVGGQQSERKYYTKQRP
jgi:hypothetical protein